ncbi:MAG: response regulator transcription factor [Phototrophicaceae bacterium]
MATTVTETKQILIVEDDDNTAEVMKLFLTDAGFRAHVADDGQRAIYMITRQRPDLILLDLHLPDIHGIDLLRNIRAKSFIPMIVVSGTGSQDDKVASFELGADDFIVKPFSMDELVARVRALLRRVDWTPEPQTQLVVRQLELDMPRRQASISNKKLHLTPIEYGILVTLMRYSGSIITHHDLLMAVWGESYGGDYSVLRVNISRLRLKLEENPRFPRYIVTVPGQGYTMPID